MLSFFFSFFFWLACSQTRQCPHRLANNNGGETEKQSQ
jgi:hypothetical protein